VTDSILDGIRVIDLTWGLAGPVATQLLAEAGAEVIKVEPPGGDPTRELHPAAFASWNRSKRSVVLDLHDTVDRATLRDLVASADVLVHNFSATKAARWEVDDASLSSAHPRLVVCALTGYPGGHADAERPGYDILVQARAGYMDFQSGWRPGPFLSRFLAPSWFAALLAAAGILARLINREATGTGGAAHTSLLQGVRLAENIMWARAENPSPSLLQGLPGTLSDTQVAMYECGDGRWLQILNPADRVDLSKLPLTMDALIRIGRQDAPFDADVLRAAMRQHPSTAWLEAIRAVDVAVALITPLGALLMDEGCAANGYLVDVEDPVWGPTRQAAAPFVVEPPSRVSSPAPLLGEYTPTTRPAPRAAPTGKTGQRTRPLEGVRVLDLGAFLAGPLAPMLLADLGAEVIKVEPVSGDPVRGWRDGFFVACNRGKRGIALDLTKPNGRAVLAELVARADVVHHNMRMPAAARLGIDEDSLRAINPQVIFSHGSSYGLQGPRATWPGYDSVFQAMSGWNIENAGEGNPPLFVHAGTLDQTTALSSTVATLLALYRRTRTHEGSATYTSLLNTATFTNSETLLCRDDNTLAPYPRLDHDQTGLAPCYRIFETSAGWVAVAALTATSQAALRQVAGVTDDAALEAALHTRSADELLSALEAAGVPAERVEEYQYFAVWDDSENIRTKVVVSYPQAQWGRMDQFGAFWSFRDLELQLDRACPAIGEHSRDILAECGYSDDAIAGLAAAGIVVGPGLTS
jgi:crotonobetainyl-CoA:carnitine CoA-transferase CaiB-like acyl-CoA transferase